MDIEPKLLNPIVIRLGKNSNVVVFDDIEYPLVPGVMLGEEHYGFILIIDYNGKQKEVIYPTQCMINAVGINNNDLNVFEENKKFSWKFDKKGKLKHSIFNEFDDKNKYKIVMENSSVLMGEPKLINPLKIFIKEEIEESIVLIDEITKENYPLYPGVMLDGEHYGVILVIDTYYDGIFGKKEIVYPTQNRIDSVGKDINHYNDLKIFENGKYHPWVFDCCGKLKQISSYNLFSRRDEEYVKDCFSLNDDDSECFVLRNKK